MFALCRVWSIGPTCVRILSFLYDPFIKKNFLCDLTKLYKKCPCKPMLLGTG